MIASIETLGSRQTLEPRFVSKVLAPYFEHTTYLKEATMIRRATHGSEKPRELVAAGEFHIGQSCYIQSTGHFNAVEFNICFNQLAYVTYAYCFETEYFRERHPEWGERLDMLNPTNFAKNQLSSMLIVNLASKFKKEIRGNHFQGELEIGKMRTMRNCMFSTNHVKFYDDEGGFAEGDVTLALVLGEHA